MVHWIRLKSYHLSKLEPGNLMPEETRDRARDELFALKRMQRYGQLFGAACPVPDLRAGRVIAAKTDLPDEDEVEDVAAVLSRITHVEAAPEACRALKRDAATYACGLTFRDLRIGCAAIYTEVPDPRIGFFWRGASGALGKRLKALSRDAEEYDDIWSRVLAFPAEG